MGMPMVKAAREPRAENPFWTSASRPMSEAK